MEALERIQSFYLTFSPCVSSLQTDMYRIVRRRETPFCPNIEHQKVHRYPKIFVPEMLKAKCWSSCISHKEPLGKILVEIKQRCLVDCETEATFTKN